MDDNLDNLIQSLLGGDFSRVETNSKVENFDKFITGIVASRIYGLVKKSINTILGCTPAEFKQHIDSQLDPGMTWDNHGDVWHIDHITPLKYPIKDGDNVRKPNFFEILPRFHYTNCQPLDAKANIAKGNRFIGKHDDGNALTVQKSIGYCTKIRGLGAIIAQEECVAIATADELDEFSYDEMVRTGVKSRDRLKMAKARLRRMYCFYGPMTPEFVKICGSKSIICNKVARHQIRHFEEDTSSDALAVIARSFFIETRDGVETKHIRDLFSIARHDYALGFLRMFALDIGSARVITRAEMIEILKKNHKSMVDNCANVCAAFGCDVITLPEYKEGEYPLMIVLKYLNGKLESQYGVKLKAFGDKRKKFKLFDLYQNQISKFI